MTTFEKTWQFGINYIGDQSSAANNVKNEWWWHKAFIKGDLPIRRLAKTASGDGRSHFEVAGTTQDLLTQGLWTTLASSDGGANAGITTITSGSNGVSLPQSTINVVATASFASPAALTWNGGSVSLPQSTITANASTASFPSVGTIAVTSSAGVQYVSYTGISGSTFTGCTGGTGTMTNGNAITIFGTIYVGSSNGLQAITYTGTTGTTFTGCSGGTGTLTTGNIVCDCMDRWNGAGGLGTTTLNLGGNAGSTNSGSAASFTTGATIVGAIRMTGLANMTANDVGNFLNIMGATTPGNNSPTVLTSSTPFKIVNFVSSSSVDIYNPFGSTSDAYNGSIAWIERNPYNLPGSTAGNYSTIVNAVTGSNHTWMLLQSPSTAGPYYFVLDYNNASAQNGSFNWSKTITSVTNTPSSTTAPTFQDTTSFNQFAWNSNQVLGMYHGMLSTDGYFIQMQSRVQGVGYVEYVSFFQILANTKSTDQYPYVYYNRLTGGSEAMNSFYNTGGNWQSRTFNGALSQGGLTPLWLAWNPNAPILSWNTSTGDLSNADFSDSQYDDHPLYVANNVTGYYTLKGRLVDIKAAPSLPTGFTEPNPSAPQSICVGGVWYPCNLPFLL